MPAFVSLRRPVSVVIAALVALALMPLFSPSASAAPLAAEPSLASSNGAITGRFDTRDIPEGTNMRVDVFEKKAMPNGHPWTERPELAVETPNNFWRVVNVPPGDYTLRFSVIENKRISAYEHGLAPIYLGNVGTLKDAQVVTVKAGEESADHVVKKVYDGTSIRPWVSVSGGAKAAESVTLYEDLGLAGGPSAWRKVGTYGPDPTDSSGVSFMVRHLGPGKYKLRYDPVPGVIGRWYNDAGTEADATVFTLGWACGYCDGRKYDARLATGPGAVTGKLTFATGAPNWLGTVQFVEKVVNDDKTTDWIERPELTQQYDPRVPYQYDKLPVGEYTLRFLVPNTTYGTTYLGGVARLGDAKTVKVVKGEITQAPETLMPLGGRIVGKAVDAAGTGAIRSVTLFEAFPGENGTVEWKPTREIEANSSNGDFIIPGLAPTEYKLRFNASEPYMTQYSGGTDTLGNASAVEVLAGKDSPLRIELPKGGTLEMSVGLAGKTEPAPTTTPVELFQWTETSTGLKWVKKAEKTVDLSGKVSFGGLDTGEYTLKYGGDSTKIGEHVAHYAGDPTDSTRRAWHLSQAAHIPLNRGEVKQFAPTLRLDSTISGVIRDANDSKISIAGVKATLWAKRIWGTDTEETYRVLAEQDVTKSAEGFAFKHLGPGAYKLQFTAKDGTPYKSTWHNLGAKNIEEATEITIQESSTQRVHDVPPLMEMGGEVSGTVLDHTAGSGLNGFRVYLYEVSDRNAPPKLVRDQLTYTNDTTSTKGTYSFSGLGPGTYKVRVNDEGENDYVSTWVKDNVMNGADTAADATAYTVAASSMKHVNKKIALKRGLVIGGTVSGASGGAQVQAQLYTAVDGTFKPFGKPVSTTDQGVYARPGLRAGTYKIGFTDLRTAPVYRERFYVSSDEVEKATPVTVLTADSKGNNITMPNAATISGKVSGGEDSLTSVKAVAYRRTGTGDETKYTAVRTAAVSATGDYLITPLPAGDFKVRFVDEARKYAPVVYDKDAAGGVPSLPVGTELALTDGQAKTGVDVKLPASAILGGKLNHDAPQADLTVTVYRLGGELGLESGFVPIKEIPLGTSDVQPASWSLNGLPTGEYRVRVADSTGTLATQFFGGGGTLDDSKTLSIPLIAGAANFRSANMTLKGASKIQGVLTKDGKGVYNVLVRAWRLTSTTQGDSWSLMPVTARSMPSGAYTLGGLPAGTYRVEFDDQDHGLATEFYNNAPDIKLADSLDLEVGQIFKDVDAKLDTTAPAPKETSLVSVSLNGSNKVVETTAPKVSVTVESPGHETPQGWVYVQVDGKEVAKQEVDEGGLASLTLPYSTATFPLGRHEITATYGGSDKFRFSSSTAVTLSVVPPSPKTFTTLRLGAERVESQDRTTADVWVDALGQVPPAGTIELMEVTATGLKSFVPRVTGTLVNGHVQLQTPLLGEGAYFLRAVYAGDRTPSESGDRPLSVVKAGSAVTMSLEEPQLVSGQQMVATVTVKPNSPAKATGVVSVFEGSTHLGSANLDATGTARVTIPEKDPLSVGGHELKAVYNGNADLAQAETVKTTPLSVLALAHGTDTRVVTAAPAKAVYGTDQQMEVSVKRQSDSKDAWRGKVWLQRQEGTSWLNVGAAVDVTAGKATVAIPAGQLDGVGVKTLRVAYRNGALLGDSATGAFNLEVTRAGTTASASVLQANPVGETSKVSMAVSSQTALDADLDGDVHIYVDDVKLTATGVVTDGKGTIDLAGLSLGAHKVRLVFVGNDLVTSSEATVDVTVPSAASSTKLTITKPSVKFDEDVAVKVEVSSPTVPAAQVSGTATLYLHRGTANEKVLATGSVSGTTALDISFKANKLAIGTNSVEAVFTPGATSPVGTSSAAKNVDVAKAKFSKVGTATITGTAKVGQTLTANPGDWAAEANKAYTWFVDGTEDKTVAEPKNQYPLKPAHEGKKITVKVTGTATGYDEASSTSVATAAVAKGTIDNPPAVTIDGELKVGKELTAKHDDWPAGIQPTYAWSINGQVVDTAKAKTFTLEPAHVGASVSVTVSGSAEGYDPATSTSPASDARVAKGTFEAKPKVTVTGTAQVASTLTAKSEAWPTGTVVAYSWIVDGKEIGKADKLTIAPAQVGKKITLKVTGTVPGYDPADVTVGPTAPVASAKFTLAPKPVIVGQAKVNGVLSVRVGTWKPAPRFTAQWMANGVPIKGATRSSFKPTAAYARKRIQVAVTASAPGYVTTKVVSNPVTVGATPKVNPAAAVAWKVSAKKKGTATLVLRAGRLRPTGTVQVFDGRKGITRKLVVKLAAGNKMVIKLPKLKKGKHVLKLVYSGNAQINAKTVVKAVKVKK
ncbi:Ig-like domain repeat protein [Aeromicrobium massiliense]|uniref:Ig-like domain repeat protein n=1 Tax=Aeromicrobium massiliense TaxID=1464554 RepID=UPI00031041BA|nr:Ig-like domain repeat protein [Aeromicrobium massiliense]